MPKQQHVQSCLQRHQCAVLSCISYNALAINSWQGVALSCAVGMLHLDPSDPPSKAPQENQDPNSPPAHHPSATQDPRLYPSSEGHSEGLTTHTSPANGSQTPAETLVDSPTQALRALNVGDHPGLSHLPPYSSRSSGRTETSEVQLSGFDQALAVVHASERKYRESLRKEQSKHADTKLDAEHYQHLYQLGVEECAPQAGLKTVSIH